MKKTERQQYIIDLVQKSTTQDVLGTRELAEKFGVSEMTVRRDFEELSHSGLLRRQHGGVAPPLRLYGQQTNEIGIILVSRTGRYSDPFYNAILEGAAEKLHELGYRIAYINTRSEVSSVTQARELLRSHPVDGIILVGFVSAESIDFLKANVRAVIQTTDDYSRGIDTITFDGYGGMQELVHHLVRLGHRRLGFISGSGGHDGRLKGFKDAIQAHGLPADEQLNLILSYGLDGWTPELGQQGAEHLMTLTEPPDAIVCASDRIAMGAIQWLHQHNYNVPRDVAVTGFDNLRESAFTAPALTTVHIHKELIGQLAAERAVKHIQHPDEIPLYIKTPTSLVIRQSCGSKTP